MHIEMATCRRISFTSCPASISSASPHYQNVTFIQAVIMFRWFIKMWFYPSPIHSSPTPLTTLSIVLSQVKQVQPIPIATAWSWSGNRASLDQWSARNVCCLLQRRLLFLSWGMPRRSSLHSQVHRYEWGTLGPRVLMILPSGNQHWQELDCGPGTGETEDLAFPGVSLGASWFPC